MHKGTTRGAMLSFALLSLSFLHCAADRPDPACRDPRCHGGDSATDATDASVYDTTEDSTFPGDSDDPHARDIVALAIDPSDPTIVSTNGARVT